MKIIHKSLVTLTVLALSCTAAIAQSGSGFSSLEERMTAAEFNRAGLDKLSPDELAELNQWIRARSLAEEEALALQAAQTAPSTPPIDAMPKDKFESRIVGSFSGWTGDSDRVELENGMVWEQVGSDTYRLRGPVDDPTVILRPGMFDSWTMQIEGYNKRVSVRRVE